LFNERQKDIHKVSGIVNGYSWRSLSELDFARRGIDPANPKAPLSHKANPAQVQPAPASSVSGGARAVTSGQKASAPTNVNLVV
jgi:hypothetical protein